ncbi:MAG: hypothetical protein NNA22_11810, partial [Nitrospira sp.]|nr:hypothetical protein [Nitrospira sp.]
MNQFLSLNEHLTLAMWYQAAYATGGMGVLLVLWILCIRIGRSITRYQSRLISQTWKAIFEGRAPLPPKLPSLLTLGSRDRVLALTLWNTCYDKADRSTDTTARLVDLAKRLPLQRWARTLLRSRRLHRKMLAIRTLGRLGDRTMWSPLYSLLTHPNPFVALHA